MPDYYRSNPALTWIANEETPFRWIDDSHFAVLDNSPQARGDWCAGEVWNVYDLSAAFTEIANPCAIFPECMIPPPEPNRLPKTPGFFPGDVAPDGNNELSIDWVEYGAATPVGIKLGDEVTDQTVYEQVWLVDLKDGTVNPLFYSTEFFIYQWADDSRHLVGIGSCYDKVGSGLFTFDTQTGEVYWLDGDSNLCEGDTPPLIAPGFTHLIDDSGVVRSLHGAQRVRI